MSRGAPSRASGLGLSALLDSTKEVRSSVLELVQAARSVFSNPFDFLSKQVLDNCRNNVGRYPRRAYFLLISMCIISKLHSLQCRASKMLFRLQKVLTKSKMN